VVALARAAANEAAPLRPAADEAGVDVDVGAVIERVLASPLPMPAPAVVVVGFSGTRAAGAGFDVGTDEAAVAEVGAAEADETVPMIKAFHFFTTSVIRDLTTGEVLSDSMIFTILDSFNASKVTGKSARTCTQNNENKISVGTTYSYEILNECLL